VRPKLTCTRRVVSETRVYSTSPDYARVPRLSGGLDEPRPSSHHLLQKLSDPARPELAASFDRLAEILSNTRRRHSLQLQFSIFDDDAEEPTTWSVVSTKDGCQATQERIQQPDVEIITHAQTWRDIAEGRLSPLEAFVKGRLRVRGNIQQAKRIFLVDLAATPAEFPARLR
jgi:putative sterol carrier protein